MTTQKPLVRLEGWAVVAGQNRGVYEPLQPGSLLLGRAYGHQRIESGMFIFSSPIVRVDAEQNIAETRNTSYQLGAANPDYRAWAETKESAA
jgi:hypothetical protein